MAGNDLLQAASYDVNDKGFFIIMANMSFHGHKPLDYSTDVEKLAQTFNLRRDGQTNVLEEINLTNRMDSPNDKNFNNFMQREVLGYESEEKPSFVMCFLMSHGDASNNFVLANSDCDMTSREEPDSEKCRRDPETGYYHSCKDGCKFRNYYDSIINPINESKRFRGIPKIFVMQLCRGRRHASLAVQTGASPGGWNFPELNGCNEPTDYYIMFPCAHDHPSFITQGSVMIDALVKAVEKLKVRHRQVSRKRAKRDQRAEAGAEVVRPPIECETEGWIEDIGMAVRGAVPNTLFTPYSETEAGFFRTLYGYFKSLVSIQVEKSQPECISTLNKRLSFVKILETQKALTDGH